MLLKALWIYFISEIATTTTWWCIPAIVALRRLRQEKHLFKVCPRLHIETTMKRKIIIITLKETLCLNLSYFHYAWHPSWRAATVPVVSVSGIFNPLYHSLNTLPRIQETEVYLFFSLVTIQLQDGVLASGIFHLSPAFTLQHKKLEAVQYQPGWQFSRFQVLSPARTYCTA